MKRPLIQFDPATASHVISVAQSNDGNNGGPAADTLGAISARGPQRNPVAASIALKPDLTAPGVNIVSADAGTITGSTSTGNNGGTSAAAAHIAGVMALRYGLGALFDGLEPGMLFRLIRYTVIGLWLGLGAPWVFVKTGLAGHE